MLQQYRVSRIGLEATGGYERGIANELRQQGFTVVVMQPLQVKAFAKLHLRRAKNDRLDATLIAACTAAINSSAREHDPRFEAWSDHYWLCYRLICAGTRMWLKESSWRLACRALANGLPWL